MYCTMIGGVSSEKAMWRYGMRFAAGDAELPKEFDTWPDKYKRIFKRAVEAYKAGRRPTPYSLATSPSPRKKKKRVRVGATPTMVVENGPGKYRAAASPSSPRTRAGHVARMSPRMLAALDEAMRVPMAATPNFVTSSPPLRKPKFRKVATRRSPAKPSNLLAEEQFKPRWFEKAVEAAAKRTVATPRPPTVKRGKKPCTAEQILNPATGKCVKRDGKIGRTLLAGGPVAKPAALPAKPSARPSRAKDCPPDKIRNPASGRCVDRNGKIGRTLT